MSRSFAYRLLILLVVALACGGLHHPVSGQPAPSPFRVNVHVTRQGSDVLVSVQGTGPAGGAWVGCSLYPKGVRDLINQGSHTAAHVASTFSQAWKVPAGFEGGTYEVVLWTRRVPKSQCKLHNDPWCRRNGFHMEGMLVYRTGYLTVR